MQQFGVSMFNMVMYWYKLGKVEIKYTLHNSIVLSLFVPNIIKFGKSLTKL